MWCPEKCWPLQPSTCIKGKDFTQIICWYVLGSVKLILKWKNEDGTGKDGIGCVPVSSQDLDNVSFLQSQRRRTKAYSHSLSPRCRLGIHGPFPCDGNRLVWDCCTCGAPCTFSSIVCPRRVMHATLSANSLSPGTSHWFRGAHGSAPFASLHMTDKKAKRGDGAENIKVCFFLVPYAVFLFPNFSRIVIFPLYFIFSLSCLFTPFSFDFSATPPYLYRLISPCGKFPIVVTFWFLSIPPLSCRQYPSPPVPCVFVTHFWICRSRCGYAPSAPRRWRRGIRQWWSWTSPTARSGCRPWWVPLMSGRSTTSSTTRMPPPARENDVLAQGNGMSDGCLPYAHRCTVCLPWDPRKGCIPGSAQHYGIFPMWFYVILCDFSECFWCAGLPKRTSSFKRCFLWCSRWWKASTVCLLRFRRCKTSKTPACAFFSGGYRMCISAVAIEWF